MKVGVPSEIKTDEYRVALTPAGVRELVDAGHDVCVQSGAGLGSSIEDDDYAPVPAVQALAPLYGLHGANAEVLVVRPRDHGLRHLGHFGFFRKTAPRILWDEALSWLRKQVGR